VTERRGRDRVDLEHHVAVRLEVAIGEPRPHHREGVWIAVHQDRDLPRPREAAAQRPRRARLTTRSSGSVASIVV